jgi:hypothetical protein
MRHTISMAALLLVSSLAVGCWGNDGGGATNEQRKPGSAVEQERDAAKDKAKQETKQAAQAMLDYAYAQKAEFVAGMKLELAEIQKDLDRLTAEVENSRGEAKAAAKQRLDAVREKWAKTQAQLEAAEAATESNWDDVKRDFKDAYGDMKRDFNETRQWLSDEIEPKRGSETE